MHKFGHFIVRQGRNVIHIERRPDDDKPEILCFEYPCDTISTNTMTLRGEAWDGQEVPCERSGAVDCQGKTRWTRRYFYRGVGYAVEVSVIGDVEGKLTVVPYPVPKTKLPTRYKNGAWEKQHKTRGWIPA